MTRQPGMRRPAVLAFLLAITAACASAPRGERSWPIRLAGQVPPDSALRIVRAVLLEEELPVDGDVVSPGMRTMTSTFRVRAGGLGESTIVFRFHAAADSVAGSRLTFDASAEERGRALAVGVDDPRDPRQRRGVHEVNPNDRDVWRRVDRLLDRLSARGFREMQSGT